MSFFVYFIHARLLAVLPVRWSRHLLQKANIAPTAVAQKKSSQTKRQLLVDVSVIYQTDARTGIQRVVRALILQLLKTPIVGHTVRPIFATRQDGYRYAEIDFLANPAHQFAQDEAQKRPEVSVQNGDIFFGLDLAAHLLPKHRQQLLNWKMNGVKLHVLVYDLLPLQHPEWFNAKTTQNFKRWVQWLAVYADSAVCISQTVAAQLTDYLGKTFNLQKWALPTSTIVLGANIDASAPTTGMPADAPTLLECFKNTSSVLMVGTLEPRKGHDQALAAFEKLWQAHGTSPLLVIVGRPGWKTESLQAKLRSHPETGKKLFWLEQVSDEYLMHLYSACSGVLVASNAEGFGLPVVEAVIQANSVLVRDLPVFREIPLPDDCFFKADTATDLAQVIAKWILNKPILFANEIIEFKQKFSWEMSVIQLQKSIGVHPFYEGHDQFQLDGVGIASA